jgi:hypothetical protein
MIRIGLPPAMWPRLRLHWHVTRTAFSRQTRALQELGNRTADVYRAWWQHVTERVLAPISLRAWARQRSLSRLARFEERYEDLVDLLCWSAKDGIHTDRDARYTEMRRWMQRHYPRVRPHLRPHWKLEATERDPFAALFASDNVDEFINGSGGIEDIMRSRAALEACRSELETPGCTGAT